MSAEIWTIGRLLTWTTDYLSQHGADSPRLDAEVLLAHVRGCQRIELYTAFDEPAGEDLKSAYRALVKRRAEGAPVSYLVGQREFFSLPFQVTPDVLIPRPETEHVVLAMLDRAKSFSQASPLRIADVGTGSGVLAICGARHLPRAQVTAIDKSAAALEVARKNAARLEVVKRVEFVESDLFDDVDPTAKFEIIVSNPPYVKTSEYESLPRDVREFEPKDALVAGGRGSEVIERLIDQAAQRLTDGGTLICEISPQLKADVEALFASKESWRPPRFIQDLAGLHRAFEVSQAFEASLESGE